jgi:hypothetical protein
MRRDEQTNTKNKQEPKQTNKQIHKITPGSGK